MEDWKRPLLWHGMFLFFLGLATGLIETQFPNPRMGLAAHLEGIMNGTFLIALGAIWQEVRLGLSLKRGTYWTALYGTYANWAVTTFAAVFGTGAFTPVTAPGRVAEPWQEAVVSAGFVSVGITMLAASLLVLWGLRKNARV